MRLDGDKTGTTDGDVFTDFVFGGFVSFTGARVGCLLKEGENEGLDDTEGPWENLRVGISEGGDDCDGESVGIDDG